MPLTRDQKWERKLHDYIESKRSAAFAYGSCDCALFTCDGIQAMTGTDIAAEFRGKYTTELGAAKVIKQVTGGSTVEDVADYVTKQFDMKEWPGVLYAQRGDAVIFDMPEGPTLGLVYLDGRHAVFIGSQGLRRQPVKQCRRAWRVG